MMIEPAAPRAALLYHINGTGTMHLRQIQSSTHSDTGRGEGGLDEVIDHGLD